ncbi:hypothetical protein [Desulfosporosinus meridiei]|uniref:DUF4760 domain-containing protein n=1 Tax=Desulfosporosinus meridiei (strain ATCC BAA-275 / DSM 13257 / KCTC 12902 / NCIMB 13706 / S10) TaxID=768704 RepID=J7IW37_DESMD|nr:hypothetical protein [Desulfosporosinus meridiei]AFQ44359.1 hypothetical protein Desmer_2440 [Desulfosporosinus meridiei DSM 13257]
MSQIITGIEIKDIAYMITALVALLTFVKVVREYILQGKQKRVELLEKYRKRFHEAEYVKSITPYIEDDDECLMELPRIDKYYYLGFFEEVAVLLNSKVIKKETVHYFFGYYAIKTWESKNFWGDINRESLYWSEFKRFAQSMKEYEQRRRNRCFIRNLKHIRMNPFEFFMENKKIKV